MEKKIETKRIREIESENEQRKEIKKGIIKTVSATALCLAVFGAGFAGINNITLAAATEGTESLPLATAAANIPVANAASALSGENQKPDMEIDVIFESDTVMSINAISPAANAMSPEAAAEIGAQYIWEMFGESIDGTTVHMFYSHPPAGTRANWIGTVLKPGTSLLNRESSVEDRIQFHRSTLFTFAVDAVTGEWINISTDRRWMETSEEVRAAFDELFNIAQGRPTEEMAAMRKALCGVPPTQLDEYIEAAREHAQRHFTATEVVSVEFTNVNAIAFDLDENGNLFATERQLIFDAMDSTGRVAELAIIESTKELMRLGTSLNDIIPGFVFVPE